MWIIFSILAALCWAIINIVDKYIITKWVRKPIIPVIILSFISLIAGITIYFIKGFSYLSYFNLFLVFIAGVFYILMILLFFKALQLEEVSRVVPLFYLAPLFILIFAGTFLGEIFTPLKYLGIFLLMIGTILISSKDIYKIRFSKGVGLMILSALALSINQILTKYLLGFADYWTIFSYTRIAVFIGLIPFTFIYFPELRDTVKRHGKKVVVVISLNETFNLFAVFIFTIAVSIGYVTLVNSLSSIQPFFVLLFALILSIFYPHIIKEKIDKSVVILKFLAIALMFIGVILIV